MSKRRYVAVYTDSDLLVGCDHKHNTILSAVACITAPGGYVVAVRRGKYLSLTDAEDAEFQQLRYGHAELTKRHNPDFNVLVRVPVKPL